MNAKEKIEAALFSDKFYPGRMLGRGAAGVYNYRIYLKWLKRK